MRNQLFDPKWIKEKKSNYNLSLLTDHIIIIHVISLCFFFTTRIFNFTRLLTFVHVCVMRKDWLENYRNINQIRTTKIKKWRNKKYRESFGFFFLPFMIQFDFSSLSFFRFRCYCCSHLCSMNKKEKKFHKDTITHIYSAMAKWCLLIQSGIKKKIFVPMLFGGCQIKWKA